MGNLSLMQAYGFQGYLLRDALDKIDVLEQENSSLKRVIEEHQCHIHAPVIHIPEGPNTSGSEALNTPNLVIPNYHELNTPKPGHPLHISEEHNVDNPETLITEISDIVKEAISLAKLQSEFQAINSNQPEESVNTTKPPTPPLADNNEPPPQSVKCPKKALDEEQQQLDQFLRKHGTSIKRINKKQGLPLTKLLTNLKNSAKSESPIHMLLRKIAKGKYAAKEADPKIDSKLQMEIVQLMSKSLIRRIASDVAQTGITPENQMEIVTLIRMKYQQLQKSENKRNRFKPKTDPLQKHTPNTQL